jgi:hypothetical protein
VNFAGFTSVENRGDRSRSVAAHTPAYWIKLAVQRDGTFTVTNSRNGFSKTYTKRSGTR